MHDVRTAPPPPPAKPPADQAVADLRRLVDDLASAEHAIGELMLQVAPGYLADTDAARVLAPLCEEIGKELQEGLAARRYARAAVRAGGGGCAARSARGSGRSAVPAGPGSVGRPVVVPTVSVRTHHRNAHLTAPLVGDFHPRGGDTAHRLPGRP